MRSFSTWRHTVPPDGFQGGILTVERAGVRQCFLLSQASWGHGAYGERRKERLTQQKPGAFIPGGITKHLTVLDGGLHWVNGFHDLLKVRAGEGAPLVARSELNVVREGQPKRRGGVLARSELVDLAKLDDIKQLYLYSAMTGGQEHSTANISVWAGKAWGDTGIVTIPPAAISARLRGAVLASASKARELALEDGRPSPVDPLLYYFRTLFLDDTGEQLREKVQKVLAKAPKPEPDGQYLRYEHRLEGDVRPIRVLVDPRVRRTRDPSTDAEVDVAGEILSFYYLLPRSFPRVFADPVNPDDPGAVKQAIAAQAMRLPLLRLSSPLQKMLTEQTRQDALADATLQLRRLLALCDTGLGQAVPKPIAKAVTGITKALKRGEVSDEVIWDRLGQALRETMKKSSSRRPQSLNGSLLEIDNLELLVAIEQAINLNPGFKVVGRHTK